MQNATELSAHEKAKVDLTRLLTRLAEELGERTWLSGKGSFGMADVAFAPVFTRLRLAAEIGAYTIPTELERVKAWGDRILARESVKGSVPANFVERAIARLRSRGAVMVKDAATGSGAPLARERHTNDAQGESRALPRDARRSRDPGPWECWDPGSAVLLQEAGFAAIGTTSTGIAFSQALPDGEKIGRERMLEICGRIAAAATVPVTFDLEAGYGHTTAEVAITVRGAIACGAVGCNIEDGQPHGDEPLAEFGRAVEKIRAAGEVARASEHSFVLNVRVDAYLRRAQHPDNFAETVRRGVAYREAGADCIYIPGVKDPTLIERLHKEIGGPINIMAVGGGPPSALSVADYARLGVKRVSFAGGLLQAAFGFVLRSARELQRDGTFGFAKEALPHLELMRMMIRNKSSA